MINLKLKFEKLSKMLSYELPIFLRNKYLLNKFKKNSLVTILNTEQ